MEGEVGRFRRNHLVPVPVVESLDELNARLERADVTDESRRIQSRARSVGQDFAVEQRLLQPLPDEVFESGLWLTPRVDRFARVTVRCGHYSVPVALIGRKVRVCLRASHLVVFDGRREVARHARSVRKGSQTLVLDHYLEVLAHKPGALAGATALAQARQSGLFTPAHEAFWAAARRAHGDTGGTRALVEVLLLHRHLPHADVVAGLAAAVAAGASTADVVAVEARKASDANPATRHATPPSTPPVASPPQLSSLTARRLTVPARDAVGLPADTRPPPSVAHYDELLLRRRPPPANPGGADSSTTGRVS